MNTQWDEEELWFKGFRENLLLHSNNKKWQIYNNMRMYYNSNIVKVSKKLHLINKKSDLMLLDCLFVWFSGDISGVLV